MRPAVLLLAIAVSALPMEAQDPPGAGRWKIQVGVQGRLQASGLVDGAAPESREDRSGPLVHLAFHRQGQGRWTWGLGLGLAGQRLVMGPRLPNGEIQVFGIAAWRVMAEGERVLKVWPAAEGSAARLGLLVGLGWEHPATGAKVAFLGAPPPPGTPLRLRFSDSPAAKIALVFHRRVTDLGLALHLEGGLTASRPAWSLRTAPDAVTRDRAEFTHGYLAVGITLGL